MPTKKPSLFDVEGKEPPKPKAPTLKQFLKGLPKDAEYPIYGRIETIWFPGNWPNYSIETPQFRASISEAHPLFSVLESSDIKTFGDAESAILLVVVDSEGTIRFSESNFYGKYTRIGNAGFRFEPTDGAN